jgi:acyl-CoA synthetase (AMP-forming)/AMP-acid ligase II
VALCDIGLHDLLLQNAQLHGGRTAFVEGARRFSHGEHLVRVARLATGLQRAGLAAGERVAVLAHNRIEVVELMGAAACLGALVVPINWRLTADEVAWILADTTPRWVFAGAECEALLAAGQPRTRFGADFDALYADTAAPLPADGGAGPLLIVHTAAVAGRPRGAVLSQRGLVASGLAAIERWQVTPGDVNLGVLPLFHVAALGLLFAAQWAGGCTVLSARFEPATLLAQLQAERGSMLGVFPPMLGALLDAAAATQADLTTLRCLTGIEAPEALSRLQAAAPQADFWVTYGQTETSGSVSLGRFRDHPGSAGQPTRISRVQIVDDADRPLPAGRTGEIVVRGPGVFEGYWNLPEDTAITQRGGWHHTGDLGRLDAQGTLWYAGRSPAKALIKPGGENVYPAEVERCILLHPAVAEVVVLGVPDAHWGEAVKAVCVLQAGAVLDAQALQDFVAGRIAGYKKPRRVVFVPALPRTAAGVVDRAAVQQAHGQA